MVSDEDVVDAVQGVDGPVATATEVADALPIGRRAVLKRLKRLRDAGDVESKAVGARSTVWWVPSTTPPHAVPESGQGPSTEPTDVPSSEPRPLDAPEPGDDAGSVEGTLTRSDVVDAVSLPGSGSRLAERVDAVYACYLYLVEHGEGKRSTFEDEVFPEHSGGYASSYSWWKNCVSDGLQQLADLDYAIERPDYSGMWLYHD